MSSNWLRLTGTARLPFLLLTPACLLPAAAAALACCRPLDIATLWAVGCGALAAHVSVNALNEYHDFRSGLDLRTQRTPFSGGSGTLPAHPELAPAALWLGIVALLVTMVAGIWLLRVTGFALLPIGVAGVALIALYSTWIVRHPLLCLLSAGLGFGPLMMNGAGIALSGQLLPEILWASCIVGCAVNNLLLLNQIPDREPDAAAGRRTLPVVSGSIAALRVYRLFTGLALGILLLAVANRALPPLTLLAAPPLMAGMWVSQGMRVAAARSGAMTPYLAGNVAICLTVPVMLAAGLYLR